MTKTKNRNSNNKRSNRSRRNRVGGRPPTRLGGVDLPHINQKPIQTRCMRYQSDTMVSNILYNISVNDIRAMILAVVTGSANAIPLIDSFKIRRIGYSAVLSGDVGSAYVTFAWEGPNVPDISDTSYVGVGVPTTRSYYPPSGSSSSWWYDNGAPSVELFSLSQSSLDSGAAIVFLDIDFEYILQNDAVTTVNLAASAGITGVAYANLPLTQTVFVPAALYAVTTA